jgi:hypothetical protein
MLGSSHLFGGFSLSPTLARRVFEAISEMHAQALDPALSHVDDEHCEICRAARELEAKREKPDDASGTDRPGRRWTA